MAESSDQSDQINMETEQRSRKQERLRYLDFVHVAAIQALVCMSRLYDLAKENSGPLRPGVKAVEGTVRAVVGPVYEKLHGVPFDILQFFDRKVGAVVEEVQRRVPSSVKEASNQAYSAAHKAPQVARSISGEVQRAGVTRTAAGLAKAAYAKAEPAAKTLYNKYEPVAEHYAASAWKALNRLPVFPQAAQMVVPTAAHWAERYNKAVRRSAGKGYAFAGYLPLVPTERIAKVFGGNGEEVKATTAAAD